MHPARPSTMSRINTSNNYRSWFPLRRDAMGWGFMGGNSSSTTTGARAPSLLKGLRRGHGIEFTGNNLESHRQLEDGAANVML